jgi:glutathione S-transferase
MTGYRLYGWPQTGSMGIEGGLVEAAVPHVVIPVDLLTDANLAAEFTALNPRQQVPTLVLPDGTVVTECPAILAHIADAFPQARLAPEPGSSARARHDRWLAFFHANIYEAMLREAYSDRYTADPATAPAVSAAATAYIRRHFQIFEAELGDGPYLFGQRLSMADILLWMLCHWTDADWLATTCPKIERLRVTASARPALRAVLDRHYGHGD